MIIALTVLAVLSFLLGVLFLWGPLEEYGANATPCFLMSICLLLFTLLWKINPFW